MSLTRIYFLEYSAKGYEIFPSKSSNSTGSLKNDPFDLNSCSGYKQPLFETAVTVEDMLSGMFTQLIIVNLHQIL